jgi:hypothetical protein
VREEVLIEQFGEMLDRLSMSDEIFQWLRNALRESLSEQRLDHDAAVSRLGRSATGCASA